MLARKNYLNKTIRLDSKIMDDLEALSEMLGRSQNELISIAVVNLLKCNQHWFEQDVIVFYFESFFGNGGEKETFDFEAFTVTITNNDDDSYTVDVTFEDGAHETSTFEEYNESLRGYLRRIAGRIDPNSQLMRNYIKSRLNYQ